MKLWRGIFSAKLVQGSLGDRKDVENTFHHSQGPVKLVQASLGVKKEVERIFYHSGDPAKLVYASLSVE